MAGLACTRTCLMPTMKKVQQNLKTVIHLKESESNQISEELGGQDPREKGNMLSEVNIL